jgi:hypothetical protein
MYLRRCYRNKEGKRHGYWALVESYRSSRGPRQRVVAYLGEMDAAGRLGIHQQAAGTVAVAQRGLFRDVEPQWVEVDLKRIAVERKRAFGGPWIGLELCRQVGLIDFLERTLPAGREEIPWPVMAQILILARLCDPASELQIAERFYEASALSDLLGVPANKVNEDRLYRALDQLLPHKEELERHLKNRLGELFDLDYDLLLYDVTSTYFEGEANGNELAQRGYSRDHRPAAGLPTICREPQRCDHAGRDRRADRTVVRESEPYLGARSRDGERRELEVFEGSEAALHRRDPEGHAETLGTGVTKQGLEASAGRPGGALVSRTWW